MDKRYIRVEGRPIFQIYVPEHIPDLDGYLQGLRRYALESAGIEIHLSAMVTAWREDWGFLKNFDSVTLFQPALALYGPERIFGKVLGGKASRPSFGARLRASPRLIRRVLYIILDMMPKIPTFFNYDKTWVNLYNQYKNAVKDVAPLHVYPMAFVDFDNTPRYRKRAKLFKGFTPSGFGKYLNMLYSEAKSISPDNMVFVNAWNEWGEGMYLQADTTDGDARLRAVRAALSTPAPQKSRN
mgnify:FL=1